MIIDFQCVVDVRSSQKSHADGHRSLAERQRAPIFALRFLHQFFKVGVTLEHRCVGQIDCSTRLNEKAPEQQQQGREQNEPDASRAHIPLYTSRISRENRDDRAILNFVPICAIRFNADNRLEMANLQDGRYPHRLSFMTIQEEIDADLKDAMRARDAERLSVLRMVKSALTNAAIEKHGATGGLADSEAVGVIRKQVKQRLDSIESFEKGGRPELAAKERKEIDFIAAYLPKPLERG